VVALQRAALAGDLGDSSAFDLEALQRHFADAAPQALLAWAAERFGDGLVVSTSFGIHSAATLHMVTQVAPKAPVIWVDTGYLPPETYRFADELTGRLGLNLHVAQSALSPARMEATFGRLWESEDPSDLDRYDRIRKVDPMRRALDELGSTAWVSGIRAEQTEHRATLPRVDRSGERFKISPVLHWTTRQMHGYLVANELPLHPLFYEGYATVGDAHASRALSQDDGHERDTRFRGLKQECGLHLSDEEVVSLDSSAL
jgi:phosphoadenosine phosphosulfate reductase